MGNTAGERNERQNGGTQREPRGDGKPAGSLTGNLPDKPTGNPPGGPPGPLVTVIIPVYNGEAFIGETVQSVLAQTHRNVKVLCLIDGTKDRSREIIESFGDPRVAVFERENRGMAHRRNEGLHMAESEHLLFLDHDDVLYPDFLETALRVMEERDAAAVAAGGHLIDAEGRILRRMYRFRKPKLTLERLSRWNELFATSQVLVKKSALLAVGGFDEGAGSAVDWDLWIRLAKRGLPFVFIDRCLMGYRLHAGNDSKNAANMLAGERYILRHTLHMFGDPDKSESYALLRYSIRARDWKALGQALRLNASLIFHPRFCKAVMQIAANHANRKRNGGNTG